MNHKKNHSCDECGEEFDSIKKLKMLRKDGKRIHLCRTCYSKNRAKHREQTMEITGIKDEIKRFDQERKSEYNKEYQKKRYEEIIGHKPREYIKGGKPKPKKIINLDKENTYIPKRYRKSQEKELQQSEAQIVIKGSNIAKPKEKNYSYLTMEEQRGLLNIFMKRDGLSFEAAKDKISEIKISLKQTRERLKEEKKSEEEILISKEELLKGLW